MLCDGERDRLNEGSRRLLLDLPSLPRFVAADDRDTFVGGRLRGRSSFHSVAEVASRNDKSRDAREVETSNQSGVTVGYEPDVLGIYLAHGMFWTQLLGHPGPHIVLFERQIRACAADLKLDVTAVASCVYLHEMAHALQDEGHGANAWPSTGRLELFPSAVIEPLAEYWTFHLTDRLDAAIPGLHTAFRQLAEHQRSPYSRWLDLRDVPPEEVRTEWLRARRDPSHASWCQFTDRASRHAPNLGCDVRSALTRAIAEHRWVHLSFRPVLQSVYAGLPECLDGRVLRLIQLPHYGSGNGVYRVTVPPEELPRVEVYLDPELETTVQVDREIEFRQP